MTTSTEVRPYHISVMVHEVLEYMQPQGGKVYIDCTFGGGGHTRALLDAADCTVVAMDWDLVALETNGLPLQDIYGERLKLLWGSFSQIEKKIKKVGIEKADGILADFGTSQYQLFERPGFSFYKDTPLDMRMSPGYQKVTAADVVNTASEKKLAEIFKNLGEEYRAHAIARVIVRSRESTPIRTTKQLATLVERVTGPKAGKRIHPATKVFQALRIYVNTELENIIAFLPAALRVLNPGGRLVCITFHSLEDRLVKQFFKDQERQQFPQKVSIVTPKPVEPSQQEVKINPAARSAKLRVLEKLKDN